MGLRLGTSLTCGLGVSSSRSMGVYVVEDCPGNFSRGRKCRFGRGWRSIRMKTGCLVKHSYVLGQHERLGWGRIRLEDRGMWYVCECGQRRYPRTCGGVRGSNLLTTDVATCKSVALVLGTSTYQNHLHLNQNHLHKSSLTNNLLRFCDDTLWRTKFLALWK